jgi:hypothetical protein
MKMDGCDPVGCLLVQIALYGFVTSPANVSPSVSFPYFSIQERRLDICFTSAFTLLT